MLERDHMVEKIIDAWSRVRAVSDRRLVRVRVRGAIQSIEYGTYLIEPEDAGQWLLSRVEAYAKSDAGRGPMQYRMKAETFFSGGFMDDDGDWMRSDAAPRDRTRPTASKQADPWSDTLATWRDTIADRKSRGVYEDSIAATAVHYLRRSGYTGTNEQALADLGVA